MAAAVAFIDESPLRLETSDDDSADGGVGGDTSQCPLADSGGSGSCGGRVAVKAKRIKKKSTAAAREPKEAAADLVCAGFTFVADGSSGPETAFEEVIPRRKVKQLKRERHQTQPPTPLPLPPPDKVILVLYSSYPVLRGEVCQGYCHLFIVFSFISLLFSHCFLHQQSPFPSIVAVFFILLPLFPDLS